jgi:hypothetical protein
MVTDHPIVKGGGFTPSDEKGKPVVRRGRKATELETASWPGCRGEGREHPVSLVLIGTYQVIT